MRLETKSHTAAICRALYAALCRVNRGDLAEKFCSTDTDASSLPWTILPIQFENTCSFSLDSLLSFHIVLTMIYGFHWPSGPYKQRAQSFAIQTNNCFVVFLNLEKNVLKRPERFWAVVVTGFFTNWIIFERVDRVEKNVMDIKIYNYQPHFLARW